MPEEPEIVVVGGSVAGVAIALHLARRGHAVLVLDRAEFPREKACGEGIMPHGVRELRALGVYDALAPLGRPFVGIGYHVDATSAIGRFPRGSGLAIRRTHLDSALRQLAASEAGVVLRDRVAVEHVVADREGCEVHTTDAIYRPRVIVGADGGMSGVRRMLGLSAPSSTAPRYGARLHVRIAPERAVRDVVDVHLHGPYEVYVTPTGEREVNLAILCGKDVSRTLGGDLTGGLWRQLLAVPALASWLEGAERVSAAKMSGPLRQEATDVIADRAVLIGDAAGFVDAITGEGISLALVSARMAADTIAAGLKTDRLSRADLRPYAAARAAYARDLRMFTEFVLMWSRHRRLARRVIANLADDPDAFGRLLAIPSKARGLGSIRPGDLLKLAFGI